MVSCGLENKDNFVDFIYETSINVWERIFYKRFYVS